MNSIETYIGTKQQFFRKCEMSLKSNEQSSDKKFLRYVLF